MAALIGVVGEFDAEKEEWTQYAERLSHFFEANLIVDEERKKSLLLTMMGPSAFKLLRNLVSPAKPGDKTYVELVETMKQHHNPTPSEIVQRYKFNSRFRWEGESIAQFLSELRALAEHCNYGASFDDMLRDRLVCGVEDQPIQRRLLAEERLTLQKATSIALAMETAARNAEPLQNPGSKGVDTNTTSPMVNMLQSAGKASTAEADSCYRCGQKTHKATNCPFKEAKCHYCGKVGHIKRVCRQWRSDKTRGTNGQAKVKQVVSEPLAQEVAENPEQDYHLFNVQRVYPAPQKPLEVEMVLEGKPHTMEIDTGASVSLVSRATYQQLFKDKRMEESGLQLKTYGGQSLKVVGSLMVNVCHGNQTAELPLVVVEGHGPSLLGRDWLAKLRLDWQAIHRLETNAVHELLEKYQAVFKPGLGTLKGVEAKLQVDPEARPRFCKARSVPYAMRTLVEKELDRLCAEGIIEPVSFAEWAAPIVPVLKSDKTSVRICGDFKLTVNQVSKLDRYPIPKIEDLFAQLAGGKSFTKLDLSQAYQQICLDVESKPYVTINTHKGLFQYNRLPYGVSSAPGIFQRMMDTLLQGMEHVVAYLDDILITGTSDEAHLTTLGEVLCRLENAGLQLQRNKCVFMAPEVTYLGHKIDAEGLHPVAEKVEAIQEAPAPKNVTELKSYLGLLAYYGKFLPNLSSTLAPLYRLLKSATRWKWTGQEQAAFYKLKKLLSSSAVLVHFDPKKDLILACDASPYGLGAVLSHRMPDGTERPVGFASQTLNPAEQNYSQIEKEGLACVFGVTRFHDYLYGHHFKLITDHKLLLGLFNELRSVPAQSSARIQRWALTLASYEYSLGFRTSTANGNADALSRLPLPEAPKQVPVPPEVVLLMEHLEMAPVTAVDIKRETARSPLLASVLQKVLTGWTDDCDRADLKPFWSRRTELSAQQGCILWGSRVVVPASLRTATLQLLHDSHPGISRMKSLGRMFVWWPGFDQDVEEVVQQCATCQRSRAAPTQAPLHP